MEAISTFIIEVPLCFEEKKDDKQIYQAHKGDIIIFRIIDGSDYAVEPELLCNIMGENQKPSAIRYEPITVNESEEKLILFNRINFTKNGIGIKECSYVIEKTGTHMFQIKYMQNQHIQYSVPIHILTHPSLFIHQRQVDITSLTIQTIMARGLGKLSLWKEALNKQIKLGYNAFHFAPLQTCDRNTLSAYMSEDHLQISNTFFDEELKEDAKLKLLKDALDDIRQGESTPLFFIDIVLNHCSSESKWILEHKESYYNTENSPHLEVAYQLDSIIMQTSCDFADKKICKEFAPMIVNKVQINEIINEIAKRCSSAKLYEYFMADVTKVLEAIKSIYKSTIIADTSNEIKTIEHIIKDYEKRGKDLCNGMKFPSLAPFAINQGFSRYGVKFNNDLVVAYLNSKHKKSKWETIQSDVVSAIKEFNEYQKSVVYSCHLQAVEKNIQSALEYMISQRRSLISRQNPIVDSYFIGLSNNTIAVHNGFLLGGDPTEDFIAEAGQRLFRRDVIVWSESIKLRYGNRKEDSKFLWKYMKTYVMQLAGIFDGFRLDNAHSTPINIGKYLCSHARKVNSNLIIIAELFTSPENEIRYCINWGINSFIRESIYWNSVDRADQEIYERQQIGKYPHGKLDQVVVISNNSRTVSFAKQLIKTLPMTIQYDITHDNQPPHKIWSNRNILPIMALASMGTSAVGTTRGVDELYNKKVEVFVEHAFRYENNQLTEKEAKFFEDEETKYVKIEYIPIGQVRDVKFASSYYNWESKQMEFKDGVWSTELIAIDGSFDYKFIVDNIWVCDATKPTRHDNNGHINNYIELKGNGNNSIEVNNLHLIRRWLNHYHLICNSINSSIFLAKLGDTLMIMRDLEPSTSNKFNVAVLITRPSFSSDINPDESVCVSYELPGYIRKVVFVSNLYVDNEKNNHVYIHKGLKSLDYFCKTTVKDGKTMLNFFKMPFSMTILLEVSYSKTANDIMINMPTLSLYNALNDVTKEDTPIKYLNALLYCSEFEEREITDYYPKFKTFQPAFAGLCGIYMQLQKNAKDIDLSGDLMDEIRANNVISYYIKRLNRYKECDVISSIIGYLIQIRDHIPTFLKPKYLHRLIYIVVEVIINKVVLRDDEIYAFAHANELTRKLILSTIQFLSNVKSNAYRGIEVSMSAGHPYFTTGCMRCWGRDTFISFNGILLVPKYFKEARDILTMFASVTRDGLIPNFHDCGVHPRYNARDATWFFLKSVVDYVNISGDYKYLQADITLQFPIGSKKTMTVEEIVQYILSKHINGIHIREERAGKEIDSDMSDKGFNISIQINTDNGFEYGGSKYNCGTWMDKMGSKEGKNKGIPGTPRDGAAVEITALIFAVVSGLDDLFKNKKYAFDSIKLENGKLYLFKDWANKIKECFEPAYWIPENSTSKFALVKGIYKDTLSSSNEEADYYLKPNYLIAMSVAPGIFNQRNAEKAIVAAIKHLVTKKSIGVKTLSPMFPTYKSYYDNHDDTNGFSYHSGPEWVWPMGHLLTAISEFMDSYDMFMALLLPHYRYLKEDIWMSLPELTNGDGALCKDSCCSQAWSVATILEALYKANKSYN